METPPDPSSSRPTWVRWVWLAVGWVCFAVGVAGVVLPGLPTTGPMLLALACFARGSPRLHAWLYGHPMFGPPLQRWKEHRIIPLRAKLTAFAFMAASLVYIVFWSGLPRWAVVAIGAFIGVGAVVVFRIPHVRPDETAPARSRGGGEG